MELLRSKPSPSGQLFAECAAAVKPMEACALLLGQLIDQVRAMTMLPLSAEGRVIVLAALRTFSQFDSVRADLEYSLGEMKRIRKELEHNGRP